MSSFHSSLSGSSVSTTTPIQRSIPNGSVYRFNPYTSQGASPVTLVSSRRLSSSHPPTPVQSKTIVSMPSPIASGIVHEDDDLSYFNSPSQLSFVSVRSSSGSQSPHSIPLPATGSYPMNISDHSSLKSLSNLSSTEKMTIPPPRVHLVPTVPDMKGNVHNKLQESSTLRYIPYSQLYSFIPSSSLSDVSGQSVRLFVGQVLHELNSQQVGKLFGMLCNTPVLRVDSHGPGCFFIQIPATYFRYARQLNGRVLFDVKGLWYAENPEAAKELHSYTASVRDLLRTVRLPRSTLVVRR